MGGHKKVSARVSDDPDELSRVSFQAILLADSFATTFRPITLERPKVLLPLVNVPMINYTLSWLESAGVEEVFVFCCAHSKQVIDYLEKNGWLCQPNFTVTTIESHNSVSAGDALRLIYEQNVIHGDFVLISGDTVSNMSLTRALQEHKDRRKKDNNAVMTMVIKQSKPNQAIHQSRLGTDELFMAIDPDTKQLLYYEDKADLKGTICLDKSLLADNPSISLQNDKQDCYIDICSPEVLSLFTDNFDYQHLRRHFLKGLLVDDIMGYKIFIHEIHSSYVARIDNFRSYDTVSKDIIHRWTYPLVPDLMLFGSAMTKLDRQGIYRASEIVQSRSAMVGPFTVIGRGTKIGDNTKISNSVIGEGCSIGSNICIEGSYVWNNVTIEDGCELRHAIVCEGVTIKSRAVLEPGSVLSFKVVIGQQTVVPAYSKVSLLQQPMTRDSDEELEYADSSSAMTSTLDKSNGEITPEASESQHWSSHELGVGGVGYVWSSCDGGLEEEWRHSVAPIPADKVAEAMKAIEDVMELTQDDSVLPTRELQSGSNDSGDDDNEDFRDESLYFEKEVEATFQRAVHENIKEDIVILEVNSLRLSYNKVAADCAGALFYSLMRLALESSYNSANELFGNVKSIITKWRKVLKSYLTDVDDQIEVILKFEEICSESGKEFSPLFTQILSLLYDKEILEEDAILSWDEEKRDADDSDKVFVTQAQAFIQWLREASEED